jgi:hypothetical protein
VSYIYVSGTNIRVPVGQELKDISLSSSKTVMSVVAAQSGPTEGVSGSPDPSGIGSMSPDPSGAGPASSKLAGKDSASSDPRGSDLLSNRSEGPERGPRHLNHHGCAPLTRKEE